MPECAYVNSNLPSNWKYFVYPFDESEILWLEEIGTIKKLSDKHLVSCLL